MDKKTELRTYAIQTLKNLPENEKQQIESKLINRLITSALWSRAETIGITMSQGFEWSTKPIIEAGWGQNKRMCVPKCYPRQKELVFYELESFDQLEVVYYDLLEPKPDISKQTETNSIDLLIVPGLLFDRNGYRIGFGGGYYDRFLTNYKNITASMCSSIQLMDQIPVEEFDIPVDFLINENEILSL
ncbi:5-formyltetrahydrofolate cyclo-ligase [Oceanobacillus damuensis]|uniref:5-formyltetrahydrofolate cyclo-ligase n=1 Tax=Oceanobacillus damuensis TaxID=937928 RepID=UPI00082F442E|nr:5-formyltetrahydrofolate cyclo-ligase [Oceanobacillus damuensis]